MHGRAEILKTLLYSDIFNFPLTKEEIYYFLISNKKMSKRSVFLILEKLKKINNKNDYFFLKNNLKVIDRKKRYLISLKKIQLAKSIIKKISILPTVKFIGISGALSMYNSDEEDDIDIFVIAEKKLAWVTRFFLIIYLKALGVYRDKKSKKNKNKVCLNMIVDEGNITLPKSMHDLFVAHEIAQLLPVLDKDGTYKKFLSTNAWIKDLLPNWIPITQPAIELKTGSFIKTLNVITRISHIEKIAYFAQKKYMENSITNETIRNGFLAFHPYNYRKFVLDSYSEKLKFYHLE